MDMVTHRTEASGRLADQGVVPGAKESAAASAARIITNAVCRMAQTRTALPSESEQGCVDWYRYPGGQSRQRSTEPPAIA